MSRGFKGRHINAWDVDQQFVTGVDENARVVQDLVVVVLCVIDYWIVAGEWMGNRLLEDMMIERGLENREWRGNGGKFCRSFYNSVRFLLILVPDPLRSMLVLSVVVGVVMSSGGGPQDTRGLRTNLNEPITWIIIIMRGSQDYIEVCGLSIGDFSYQS